MKKIVHIIIGLNVGGAELMLKRLVLHSQEKKEFQHSVISLTDVGVIGSELKSKGIPVYSLGMQSAVSTPSILLKLRKLLKELQPDVVQTWMYHADFLGGLAAKSIGIDNIIWGIRTTDVTLGRSKLTVKLRKLCALLSNHVPKVIICAADAGRKVHEKIGYDSRKMKVIPNGFDLDRLVATPRQRNMLRDECGFTDKEMVIGSVGRFNTIKNQKLFVDAAALLVINHPNIRFLMVGRDNTWDNDELVNWIRSKNLEDKFILLGERSDVPICLLAMDIFCLHSKTEGFPNVLGEAMALRLPCVTTDVGDASILLGSTGVVVSLSAPSVCEGINSLLSLDSQSLVKMGERAQQRLYDNYSLSKITQYYNDVYKSLIKK